MTRKVTAMKLKASGPQGKGYQVSYISEEVDGASEIVLANMVSLSFEQRPYLIL
jgi:hypothetical protein